MKIKTSELTGKALDWAVALSLGAEICSKGCFLELPSGHFVDKKSRYYSFKPSSDWSICVQLIDKYLDSLTRMCTDSPWVASCKAVTVDDFSIWKVEEGQTPQIAICRALVSAKMGDEVEIPSELMEKNNDQ
ncbi:phage protein NinX family protein [Xenorhabdus bharatensis]|uniref:phage protein NinX family protein n=1 Tax=Xenorhabdus bharatensis TaxID=3136256 RepID=UPI0030F465B4